MIKRYFYLLHHLLKKLNGKSKNIDYKKKVFSAEEGNDIIFNLLATGKPCMISRYGSTELSVIYHYERFKYKKEIFWNKNIVKNIQELSGVFPPKEDILRRFSKLYLACSRDIDVLGVWFKPGEDVIARKYCKKARLTQLEGLEPYYFENPWSKYLKGKKVLVIHPFEISIQQQYQNKRELLFGGKEVLPSFTLYTIKAIQTIAYNETEFDDWFQALDFMCRKIDAVDFDVAIVGAGAYGLPLASYIKRKGKQAIHLGGATQILFGIKGLRWDRMEKIAALYNEHWKRPDKSELPKHAGIVEEGCYW